MKSVIPKFVACLVFVTMAFPFIKLISSSGTSTQREGASIITSAEVIIAEYDAILTQWEGVNFCNHLSNYTNYGYLKAHLRRGGCDFRPSL